MPFFEYHCFFCTNHRENGKQCCAQGNAQALRDYAKQQLKKRGLHGVGKCRVNNAGCLDRCSEGPVLVIYPEGIWYSYKTHHDIDEIIEKHLIKGEIVHRLLLSDAPSEHLDAKK